MDNETVSLHLWVFMLSKKVCGGRVGEMSSNPSLGINPQCMLCMWRDSQSSCTGTIESEQQPALSFRLASLQRLRWMAVQKQHGTFVFVRRLGHCLLFAP